MLAQGLSLLSRQLEKNRIGKLCSWKKLNVLFHCLGAVQGNDREIRVKLNYRVQREMKKIE